MSRLPIRLRLTVAFALATLLVLAGAGLFVYLRLAADLNESVNASLDERAKALAEATRRHDLASGGAAIGQAEETFAQVLTLRGRVLFAAGGVRGAALDAAELRSARRRELRLERPVGGVEGSTRILARPAAGRAIVVGQSLDDRDNALGGVVASFAIGGPLAVLLASLLGYALATAGIAPVEAMRRRAAEVSLAHDGEQLPLGPARDEIRRLGETLNDMLDRLRGSFERERGFVADASHELRTPIAVLKTELEGALRTRDYGPDVRDALVAAVEECDHLAQLAEDLLVIARADEGHLPVRREALPAGLVLEAVRDRFCDRAAQQDRHIRLEAPADLYVHADPLRARQALGNLLDNALRHGSGDIVLRARRADGGVELEVADGGGFPPGIADRAFERFAAGDDARGGRHTGLGMSIVRAIAEAHGGAATILPGPGATVRVWLPDAPDTIPARSPGNALPV
ncbi:HAMP domain-containing sensor histidine kinase [Candidatus Solirubrobacter pratensis]|uniref:HAMP domain-containing sensor histidine kinase n=1 Tax=Candidatus Solirubrobacter pratensis TaxID=1298857 RepID=UPI000410A4DD|nr:ATP-binding protein [Candidatus Solirubrobacter pratensis]